MALTCLIVYVSSSAVVSDKLPLVTTVVLVPGTLLYPYL